MCRSRNLPMILFTVSVVSISNAAHIIYVDANGPNDPGTGGHLDPFRRIQDAIDASTDGNTVEIRPGLYTGPGNYDLNPSGLAITIRSTDPNDPNVVANTIIDANRAGRGFYFESTEDTNSVKCVIAGLTIINGYTPNAPHYGGNIYCYNSAPTIRNCVIKNGQARDSGGGFYCDYSVPRLIGCIIKDNSAGFYGGGISCYYSKAEMIGCIIIGNKANVEGGGLDVTGDRNPILINSILIDNEASCGGGLNCYFMCNTRLLNCTMAGNRGTDMGGALYCQYGGGASIENSIFWANQANQGPQICLLNAGSSASVEYCGIQGGHAAVHDPQGCLAWDSNSNINADPCFASFDANGDPNLWDLHLQSAYGRWDPSSQVWVSDGNTSPCIDAGDPNSAWTPEPWPNGKRINMGAFGGTGQAGMNGNMADFDISGGVDFEDFASIAGRWSVAGDYIEDLSGNGIVCFADLRIFANNWLWQRE